jgi:hypothetical protein
MFFAVPLFILKTMQVRGCKLYIEKLYTFIILFGPRARNRYNFNV